MCDHFCETLAESAIPVVDIEVVIFMEVVGDIDVGEPVAVDVAGIDPQSVTDLAPENTSL